MEETKGSSYYEIVEKGLGQEEAGCFNAQDMECWVKKVLPLSLTHAL